MYYILYSVVEISGNTPEKIINNLIIRKAFHTSAPLLGVVCSNHPSFRTAHDLVVFLSFENMQKFHLYAAKTTSLNFLLI